MSMKEAVECLSKREETYQSCGASYIQHNAFIDDKARDEVGHSSSYVMSHCVTVHQTDKPYNTSRYIYMCRLTKCKPKARSVYTKQTCLLSNNGRKRVVYLDREVGNDSEADVGEK